jgi:hypothetical protein
MALRYEDLDERTRQFMLEEVERDANQGNLYISPRLNELGRHYFERILGEAVREHDDEWLAGEQRYHGYLKAQEQRRTRSGSYTTARVPNTAPDTLAEGEFNQFYVRGLCRRAIEENVPEVEVFRARMSSRPRPESEAMIDKRISAQALLEDLRESQGVEPALGLPSGPNSGLSIRLPQS